MVWKPRRRANSIRWIATSEPRLVHYGVTDEEAWAMGLSCGGQIEVFIEPIEPAAGES